MAGDHPIFWTNQVGKGRIFDTEMGDTSDIFTDKNAIPHIVTGIE
jgi:type 1 glutamine amidotransferase